jgi:trans-aconitate methyltransferase
MKKYKWIAETGFHKSRNELVTKYMEHNGKTEFEGWIRTTWLPYLKTIPERLRNKFIREIADCYIKSYPEDKRGIIKVKMVRLEVELIKPHIHRLDSIGPSDYT